MEEEIKNTAEYNISNSHSPVVYKATKVNIYQQHLVKTARKITAAAKGKVDIKVVQEIIKCTSNAEEQIALYKHYLNCKGVKISLKLTNRKYSIKGPEVEAKVVELYKQGYSKYKIAKTLKLHVSTVYYIIKRNSSNSKAR